MQRLADIGENAVVARLRRLLPSAPAVATGIGDDCAVVRVRRGCANDLLLTSDPVIAGVHFAPDTPPERIGHKAIGRVLSDIAAMGGQPLWALINLVAPPRTPVRLLERIYQGARRLADRFGMVIVGGDTAAGAQLALHVFGVGRVPHGTAVLRSGARTGDRIYVSGTLGGSGAGKHLGFCPRVAEGQWLRAGGWVTAMMDLSDGLATDLPRMIGASGVGARLETARIPIAPAARRVPGRLTPLQHALGDGEDFELLFTVPARRARALEVAWRRRFRLRCTAIGVITGRSGRVELVRSDGVIAPLEQQGYEHFTA